MRSCLILVLTFFPAVHVAAQLPAALEGLGLREAKVASRDLPGWQSPDKILVRSLPGQDAASMLASFVPGVEIVGVSSAEQAIAQIPGAQALIGFCDQSIFNAADQLHWVQVYWAGVEDCVSQRSMREGELVLSNGQRLSSPTIAEHVLAMMFALSRDFPAYLANQRDGDWSPRPLNPASGQGDLAGRTLLVVGLGGIGTQVAQRGHALGMKVLATRGSRREGPDYIEYVGLAHEAQTLAARADFVVNSAPLTDSTRGMFDREFFKAMKSTAFFVSVGRGGSTVTADLIGALESGEIAGAGLDVTDPEPLPKDHALWSAPRLIITPHVAAQSPQSLQRIFALVAENLRRYVAGEPLLSVVDVKRGY